VCRAARISGTRQRAIGGASAARAWGQRYSCTADPSLRPSRLVHPAAINHALGFVERVFLATARAYCNRRDRSVAVLDADQGSVLTFAFQQASAGGSCGEKRIILWIGRLRNPTPDGQSHLRPCGRARVGSCCFWDFRHAGGFSLPFLWTVAQQAHVDTNASRESALWVCWGYAADNSVD
jgi:hypothetical protein